MNEAAPAKKSVSSTLLLTVFFAIGLIIIVLSVRKFEADLAEANAAQEAEYAAEYAALEEAAPVDAAALDGEAGEGDAPGDAPPVMEEAAPAE